MIAASQRRARLARITIGVAIALAGVLAWAGLQPCAGQVRDDRPYKPLSLVLQNRVAAGDKSGRYQLRRRRQQWDPRRTALIVCDMWDLHHCKRRRIRPRNGAAHERRHRPARAQGVFIIHAPSSCMAAYENTVMRQRARAAVRAVNLPRGIADWCHRIPAEEKGRYPIDQSDGGEDDEPAEHAQWVAKLTALGRNPAYPWKSQLDHLRMDSRDAVSDSGVEIWNMLEERGITNVVLVGVHVNMCVLGRPFGLRQMAKNGKNVVLVRDLTDTMYNPARWPFVNHYRGTDLVVEHIEKFVCPTITSDQLMEDDAPFRFKEDRRARVVLAISEDEYKTDQTLPEFAANVLRGTFGLEAVVLLGDHGNPHRIPGLAEASTRRTD